MAQRLPETLGYMSRGAEATATDRWLDLGRRSSETAVGAPSDGRTLFALRECAYLPLTAIVSLVLRFG